MNIFHVMRDANGHSWKKAGVRLFETTLGSLFPFIAGWTILKCFGRDPDCSSFIKHGEAGIVAMGIVLSAAVLIAKEFRPPFIQRRLFIFLALILAASGTLIYTIGYVGVQMGNSEYNNNTTFFSCSSIIVWSIALLFGAFVELIDSVCEQKANPDEQRKAQVDTLQKAFEEIPNE